MKKSAVELQFWLIRQNALFVLLQRIACIAKRPWKLPMDLMQENVDS
jgi:hypothetical protein